MGFWSVIVGGEGVGVLILGLVEFLFWECWSFDLRCWSFQVGSDAGLIWGVAEFSCTLVEF